MKHLKLYLGIVIGAIAVLLSFWLFNKVPKVSDTKEDNDYYILTNQISKMNKMVVMEQDFSMLQRTKLSYEVLGTSISDKQIVVFTKTNAQVSYDLNKMKLEVDSINKKLIIRELPSAEIKIRPDAEIQSMDDSFINRLSEQQVKSALQNAKNAATKSVNQQRLRSEGHKQLLQNLNNIFVLAKALHYSIEDQTGQISPQNL